MTAPWGGESREARESHPPPTLNRHRLDDLERDISREFLLQLVGVFISDVAQRLTWLDVAVKARETKRARDLAHALQGSAASLGVLKLRAVAQRLEERAEQNDWPASEALLARLVTEFEHVRVVLAAFKNETGHAET